MAHKRKMKKKFDVAVIDKVTSSEAYYIVEARSKKEALEKIKREYKLLKNPEFIASESGKQDWVVG